jgi:hypothetical protein
MALAKRLVGLVVVSVGFSGAVWAQDKRPDQAAIVDSFKQKIQDVLKAENSKRGSEHPEFVSRNAETPPTPAAPVIVPIQGKGLMAGYVLKDGSPCKTWHTGRVPAQREMERERSPLVSIPPLRGGDFQGIGVYRSDVFWGRARKASLRAQHRLDEPTKLSLGMVASLQSPLPFHLARSL